MKNNQQTIIFLLLIEKLIYIPFGFIQISNASNEVK